DRAIGEVIKNLNTVLETSVKHQKELADTAKTFEVLITGLKNRPDPIATGTAEISTPAAPIAALLADTTPPLHQTPDQLTTTQQPLIDQKDQPNAILVKLPPALKIIGRTGGVYGDFFNFYACDITLKLNGLQPGGPVRTVRITTQPTG